MPINCIVAAAVVNNKIRFTLEFMSSHYFTCLFIFSLIIRLVELLYQLMLTMGDISVSAFITASKQKLKT